MPCQRTVGGLHDVRERPGDLLLLRVTQQLFERRDFGTGRVDEPGRRLTSQALASEQHADERQREVKPIFECAHARYLAQIGIAGLFAYETEPKPNR